LNGGKEWQSSDDFIFSLLLIKSQSHIITPDMLIRFGWSEDIAKMVIDAAQSADEL
jgi:hypothetical protein